MKVAKADREDLQSTLDFFNACELALEEEKFSLQAAEHNWMDLDEEDEDYQYILKIRRSEAQESGYSEEDIDSRILMYEFLKQKFKKASCSWRRVQWAADLLIDNCCDPTEDCLAFYPGYHLNHVEAEQ